MPISFSSKSHGKIPIGFFNIETDMLLMDRYFFFSTDFCEWVIEEVFNEIINYVEVGGMPQWLNGRPPGYVTRMTDRLAASHHWWAENEAKRPEGTK